MIGNNVNDHLSDLIISREFPVYFAERMLIDPQTNSLYILEKSVKNLIECFKNNDRSMIQSKRRTGKTLSIILFSIWYSIFNDNTRILLKMRGCDDTLNFICKILSLSNIKYRISGLNIIFENKSILTIEYIHLKIRDHYHNVIFDDLTSNVEYLFPKMTMIVSDRGLYIWKAIINNDSDFNGFILDDNSELVRP